MEKVTLYTKEYCSYCTQAKLLLNDKNIEFEEIDLTDNLELREKLSLKHSWRTMPMIFIGDQFIGGFQDLYEHLSKNN